MRGKIGWIVFAVLLVFVMTSSTYAAEVKLKLANYFPPKALLFRFLNEQLLLCYYVIH